jgi:AcrR family transcriptional regulator
MSLVRPGSFRKGRTAIAEGRGLTLSEERARQTLSSDSGIAPVRVRRSLRPRRTQEERSEETRTKLIQAAIQCISDLGYSRTTLTEITRRAGVSVGAAQHHFPSKTDLIFATINYVFTEMHMFLAEMPHTSRSIEERIDHLLNNYWAWFSSPTYLAAWELIIGARQDEQLFAMIRQRIATGGKEIDQMWRKTFADSGVDDEQLHATVQFTFETLRGMALHRVLKPGEAHHRQMLDRLRKMLWRSLTGKPV